MVKDSDHLMVSLNLAFSCRSQCANQILCALADVGEPLSGGVASDLNLDLSSQHEPISLKTQKDALKSILWVS
jgi:hypothetical protein